MSLEISLQIQIKIQIPAGNYRLRTTGNTLHTAHYRPPTTAPSPLAGPKLPATNQQPPTNSPQPTAPHNGTPTTGSPLQDPKYWPATKGHTLPTAKYRPPPTSPQLLAPHYMPPNSGPALQDAHYRPTSTAPHTTAPHYMPLNSGPPLHVPHYQPPASVCWGGIKECACLTATLCVPFPRKADIHDSACRPLNEGACRGGSVLTSWSSWNWGCQQTLAPQRPDTHYCPHYWPTGTAYMASGHPQGPARGGTCGSEQTTSVCGSCCVALVRSLAPHTKEVRNMCWRRAKRNCSVCGVPAPQPAVAHCVRNTSLRPHPAPPEAHSSENHGLPSP